MNFVDIDKEKIQAYVNAPMEVDGTIRKMLNTHLGLLFFVTFFECFASVAAKGNIVAIYILLLIEIVGSVWILYLRNNVNNKKKKIILLIGVLNSYFSFGFLFTTYKIICTVTVVSFWYVAVGILIYVVLCVNANRIVLKKIMMGYYKEKKKSNITFITPAASAGFAILIANAIGPKLSQNGVVIVISVCCIFISIAASYRTHYLLKYYFMKTLNLEMEAEWVD